MCVVSMIGDDWARRTPPQYPWAAPNYFPTQCPAGPTRVEFDALKREVEALRELLRAAKIYDEATGQPDCETDDKVALIKRLADLVGVDMSDIFPSSDA